MAENKKTKLLQKFSEKSMISIPLKQVLGASYSTFHSAECWAIKINKAWSTPPSVKKVYAEQTMGAVCFPSLRLPACLYLWPPPG